VNVLTKFFRFEWSVGIILYDVLKNAKSINFIWNYKVINIKAITVILKEVLNSSIN
jgi:hypothetical protein